jgi:ribonuclease HI
MASTDTMSFDGSCDPNPGGRMGWSYILTFADGRTEQGHDEAPPNPANTVNVAEYRGLLAGLRAYLAAGGRGPLHITGDSQLVIRQVNGEYKVRSAVLRGYHAEVNQLTAQIRDLSLVWNPREHNTAADVLARGESSHAQAANAEDIYLRDDLQANLPTALASAIERLNRHPAPGFKDFASLRTGGLDAFSKIPLATLQVRAGAQATTLIAQTFDDSKAQATALRWALRGLAVQRAIRKVQVDTELAANAQHPASGAKSSRFRR